MSGKRASLVWLALLGAGLIVFGLGWIYPTLHRVRQQEQTIAALTKDKAELAGKLDELNLRLRQMQSAEGSEIEPSDPRVSTLSKLTAEERAKRLEQVKMLGETQDLLASATAAVKQLELRVQELEQTAARVEDEKRTMAALEADLQEKLADSNRVVEAMQAELKGSTERVTKLETRNKALTLQQRDLENKTSNTAKYVLELEEIQKQQEALLTGILQRYREANDRYRSLALRAEEPQRDAPASGLDLSQIQTLVGLVEEDLRQLRNLHAQTSRIQRQLRR
jgi:chromosome segregation ATPase